MSEQSSHSQRAGAHSQQTAAGRDAVEASGDVTIVNVQQGQVYLNTSRAIIMGREYEGAGKDRAYAQAAAWDGRFLGILDEAGRLEALAEPAYQRTLNSARITAAATERISDADTLLTLMAERAADDGRLTRAAIARAVQVVDDVDEGALRALVWFYGGTIQMPMDLFPEAFLDEWTGKLLEIGFNGNPPPPGWLEHLHVVGATRLDTSGAQTLKPLLEWIQGARPAFFSPGLSVDELPNVVSKYLELLSALPITAHEFRFAHQRLVAHDRALLALLIDRLKKHDSIDAAALADEMFADFKVEMSDNTSINGFSELVANKPTIKAYGEWRAALEHPPHLTHVGVALVWASMRNMGVDLRPLKNLLH